MDVLLQDEQEMLFEGDDTVIMNVNVDDNDDQGSSSDGILSEDHDYLEPILFELRQASWLEQLYYLMTLYTLLGSDLENLLTQYGEYCNHVDMHPSICQIWLALLACLFSLFLFTCQGP